MNDSKDVLQKALDSLQEDESLLEGAAIGSIEVDADKNKEQQEIVIVLRSDPGEEDLKLVVSVSGLEIDDLRQDMSRESLASQTAVLMMRAASDFLASKAEQGDGAFAEGKGIDPDSVVRGDD